MKSVPKTDPKRRRAAPVGALAFRPDDETKQALRTISELRPGLDTSSMLREAVRLYARELQLERFVAAARRRGNKGVAIVEEFEQAGDA